MTFFIGDGDASCWHGDSYFFACDQELGEIGGMRAVYAQKRLTATDVAQTAVRIMISVRIKNVQQQKD